MSLTQNQERLRDLSQQEGEDCEVRKNLPNANPEFEENKKKFVQNVLFKLFKKDKPLIPKS